MSTRNSDESVDCKCDSTEKNTVDTTTIRTSPALSTSPAKQKQRTVSTDGTTWTPSETLPDAFLSKWSGVLGSTKWRTPPYVVKLIGTEALGASAAVKATDKTFLELGCGDARICISLAKRYPHLRCEGYEINKSVYSEAIQNVIDAGLEDSVTIHLQTAYAARISEAVRLHEPSIPLPPVAPSQRAHSLTIRT